MPLAQWLWRGGGGATAQTIEVVEIDSTPVQFDGPGEGDACTSLDFPGDNCISSLEDVPPAPGGTEIARPPEHYDQPSHDVPGENTTNRVQTPCRVGVIGAKGTAFRPILRPHAIVRIDSIADPRDDDNRTFHTVDIQIGCFDGKVTYNLPVKEGGAGTLRGGVPEGWIGRVPVLPSGRAGLRRDRPFD